MSLLGELLLQKTNAANQRQNMLAEMKARGIISGLGVLGPNGESPIDDSTIDAAGDELNKLVGKTPEGKGLVQQFTGLVKHLHGRVRGDQGQGNPQGAGAGAPPPGDAGGGGAAAQGGQAGPSSPAGSSTPLLPPPPTPASSAATVPAMSQAMSTPAHTPPPPPGASVGAGNASAPSPGAPAPPATVASTPFNFARFMHQTAIPRSPVPGTPEATAAELAHGRAMADASGFKPGSREYAEILAHQNLPSVIPQRKGSQILGSDLQQSYPGIKTLTGEDIAPDQRYDLLFDSDGNTVASPSGFSAAATKPGSILYTDANGQQQEGRMVGAQPIDAQGNPLPAGTKWTPYERGLVSTTRGTTSTDPFGNVTRTTSTIAPNIGGVPTPPGIGKPKGGGVSSAPASSSSSSSSPSSSPSSSSKMPPLDTDGHIPAGTANSQVVEAANQLLDGTDKDKLPIKVRELASSLARQYGWEQDKFTPKEQNMMRLASTFIDQATKDPSLSALDDGWLARQQLSRVLADPSKENMLGAGATSLAAMNLSPQQAAFRRMYNQLVGTISGLSQLSRATRPTESSIQRLMTELPNPLTTKDSADGRATLRRLQEEIKLAMQKKSFAGQDASGGGRATPNLSPLPSGAARTADDLYNKLYGGGGGARAPR